ncbi:MAG: type II toxin-antitoxin system VapC family toxin [Thiolinea sp.]
MKAVDTNVLVRFLVQDDEAQSKIVNALLTEAELSKQPLFVSSLVVLEMIWVLQSSYQVPRETILLSIDELLSMSALVFQESSVVRDFIAQAQNNSFDLSDLLIGQTAAAVACETTLTFDKKAAKSVFFTKI